MFRKIVVVGIELTIVTTIGIILYGMIPQNGFNRTFEVHGVSKYECKDGSNVILSGVEARSDEISGGLALFTSGVGYNSLPEVPDEAQYLTPNVEAEIFDMIDSDTVGIIWEVVIALELPIEDSSITEEQFLGFLRLKEWEGHALVLCNFYTDALLNVTPEISTVEQAVLIDGLGVLALFKDDDARVFFEEFVGINIHSYMKYPETAYPVEFADGRIGYSGLYRHHVEFVDLLSRIGIILPGGIPKIGAALNLAEVEGLVVFSLEMRHQGKIW